jgi:hypothetical protein
MRLGNDLWILSLLMILLLTPLASIHAANPLPLENAAVSVNGENGEAYCITSADGVFTMTQGLGEGNYTVEINHEGYVSKVLNTTVVADAVTSMGDIELQVSGKIQGVVNDPGKNPVSGISVMCQDESTNDTVDFAVTEGDGSFLFDTDIKNGTYTVQALVSPGYGPVSYAGYASNMVSGIGASEGQTTSGVIVQLQSSGTVLGTVKDMSDVPIANVSVAVNLQDGFGPLFFGGSAITDALGKYSVDTNLPTGMYRVYVIDAKGFAYSFMADYQNATVTAGQNTTVNFVLDHSGIISGAVTLAGGDPARGTSVSAVSLDSKYYGSAQTDDGGLYRIDSGLGAGSYMVTAANDYSNMKVVNVTADVETSDVDFEITRNLAWINGSVTNSTGSPLGTASLQGEGEGLFAYSHAEFDGTYSMEIQLSPGQNSTFVLVTASAKGYFSSSQNVSVNLGETTSPVDFALQKIAEGTLTGRVIAAPTGIPPPERTVGVSPGDWFKYTVTFNWSSTDPNATMPSYFQTASEIEWMSVSVLNVSGATVTSEMVTHYRNGTETADVGLTNVDTGGGNLTNIVIGADLGANDTVYPSGFYSSWRINETVVRAYPSGGRQTNQMNLTTESNVSGVYQYTTMNNYWDKASGIVAEMLMTMLSQTNVSQMTVSVAIRLAESNIWVVPEFPLGVSIQLVLVLATAATLLFKRKLPRKQVG